jgi:hypothetical protein
MWTTKFPVSGMDFSPSIITLNIKPKQCGRMKASHHCAYEIIFLSEHIIRNTNNKSRKSKIDENRLRA